MDYLSKYEKACLEKTVEEIRKEFPSVPLEQIQKDKEEIQKSCNDLSKARYEKWKKDNGHLIWAMDPEGKKKKD